MGRSNRTPEQNRAHVAAWKKNNPDKHHAQLARWRAKNPGRLKLLTRALKRKKLVGPPPIDVPNACECCGKPFGEQMKDAPRLDHCHLTRTFRGWLCNGCNIALGLVGDTPEGVERLLRYITRAYERISDRLAE